MQRTLVTIVCSTMACHVPDAHQRGLADAAAEAPSDGIADGSVHETGPRIRAFAGAVRAVLHVGSSWYVGGGFTRVSPYGAPFLAQLDESGAPGSCLGGFDGQVRALARSGNALYVGGDFTTYRGASANYLAKLDVATCVLDTTFSPPASNGFDGRVNALAVSTDSLYVGGNFNTYRGVYQDANFLAKLDLTTGALDTTFSPPGATANGVDGYVDALAISGSSLYIAGSVTAYRGTNLCGAGLLCIAKVDTSTGALDSTFRPNAGGKTGMTGYAVYALAVSGTALYAGGNFQAVGNDIANDLAKLDLTTGALDTTFSLQGANGFDSDVQSLAVSASSLYVGGRFSAYRGIADSAHGLAKLDLTSGAIDTSFSPIGPTSNGFDGNVSTLAISGSSLYAGGAFRAYRGAPGSASCIAKLDLASGALDTTFVAPGSTIGGFDTNVNAITFDGASLYVGGAFSVYSGFDATRLVKLDDQTFALDPAFDRSLVNGFNADINALATDGTSLFAGGNFTGYGGVVHAANRVAKLDLATGDLDTSFSPPGASSNGFDDAVYALVVAGTSLYVGGRFTGYRGTNNAANHLAKLDTTTGALDTTFGPPGVTANGFDGVVSALATANGALYAGGSFSTYRGTASANEIAKLDATSGAFDVTFSPPGAGANGFDGYVQALATAGTSLYVGGGFSAYRSISGSATNLAKLDLSSGALDTTFSPPGAMKNGVDGEVDAVIVMGSSLYVGGVFRIAYGASNHSVNRIAKLDVTTAAPDTGFSPQPGSPNGFDGGVLALAGSSGSLFVGGGFFSYRAVTDAVNVAALDANSGAPQ